jgi:hypothetical protein
MRGKGRDRAGLSKRMHRPYELMLGNTLRDGCEPLSRRMESGAGMQNALKRVREQPD